MSKELRSLIKETVTRVFSESAIDLGSVHATNLLKILKKYFPDDSSKENQYKNIIYKQGLPAAFVSLSKEDGVKKNPAEIEKILSKKDFNVESGNPLGISGSARNRREGVLLTPELVNLDEYMDLVSQLKLDPEMNQTDLATLNRFFSPETFEMLNSAIVHVVDRHNAQIEKTSNGDFDNLIDPYTAEPIISFDDEDKMVKGLGAFYQNESNYKKAQGVYNAARTIKTALEKNKIAGLRWLYSNAKNQG
jgi:hypothetical protein